MDTQSSQLVLTKGLAVQAPSGTRVFEPGKQCDLFYILTSGVIKVQIVAESGREIVLYRVGPGEACVMTASCLMGEGIYNGEGIVEQPVEGYAIGLLVFNELLSISASFRQRILDAYSLRFLDLVTVLEDVAFTPLDRRLAQTLLRLCDNNGLIHCTHQFLATDLGTAREVISRLLKRWEDERFVRLDRGKIEIVSMQAIGELANHS